MKLKEMHGKWVKLDSREEYDELMQIYQDGGWRWSGGEKPKGYDGYCNLTHIRINDRFTRSDDFMHNCISLSEFKRKQGIDKEERIIKIKKPSQLKHGMSISCKLRHETINSAKISIGHDGIHICQNIIAGSTSEELFEFKYSYWIADNINDVNPTDYNMKMIVNKPKLSIKKKGLDMLNTIPARVKRLLDKSLQAMYQIGWISDDLSPSPKGMEQLTSYLWDLHAKELGELAKKELKAVEKKMEDKK